MFVLVGALKEENMIRNSLINTSYRMAEDARLLLWRGLCLLCLVVMASTIEAKQFHFSHLSIDDGLSHNDITSIIQDKDGFMWFATRDGLNRFDGKKIKTYRHTIRGELSFDVNFISSLCLDKSGNVWIGSKGISRYNAVADSLEIFTRTTINGQRPVNVISSIKTNSSGWVYFLEKGIGLYCYKPELEEFSFYSFRQDKVSETTCLATVLWIGADNRVWLGGDKGALLMFDQEQGRFHSIKIDCLHFPNDQLQVITGSDHFIYLGFQYSGVVRYDLEKKSFSFVSLGDERHQSGVAFVHDILIDGPIVWVATERGLYFCNEMLKSVTHLERDYFDPLSLSDNAVYTIYKDRDEGIWLGTYFGGVNYLSQTQNRFIEKYYPLVGRPSINGKAVREICQDASGTIWVGTEDGGLNSFDPKDKSNSVLTVNQGMNSHNIHGLAVVDNELYIGVFAAGLNVLNLSTKVLSHYYVSDDKYNVGNSIYSICYDSRKRIWIGTRKGVYWFDRQTKAFIAVKGLEKLFAHNLCEDSKGNIWLATLGQGLFCYTAEGKIKEYQKTLGDKLGFRFPVDKILSVYEDTKGCLWFGTSGYGIICYHVDKDKFQRYSTATGLPDDVAYKAVEDYMGNIWFGTNKGLVCLNPDTHKVRILTKNDGLLTNQFNYSSAFKDADNKLYFGTINGLIVVDPSEMKDDFSFPPIYLTDFQIYSKEVRVGEGYPLLQSITRTTDITLNYDQNMISFDFAVLRYGASPKNACYVQLEGLDKDWVWVDNDLRVSYSNLMPGNYTLRIKSSNSIGEWKEVRTLNILVLPPWWKSTIAYLLYAFLIGLGLVLFYIYTKRRIERRQHVLIHEMEQVKERESYHAKIEFFTNIAHEIKTPLTLIKAPLEYIIDNKQFDEETEESLDIMMKNTDRLLSLTYQLLDFRRIEEKRMVLSYGQIDVTVLLKVTYERFKLAAEQKNIRFTLSFMEAPLWVQVDVEAFTKIISNLFNNALKYSDSLIEVELGRREDGCFWVSVSNDGRLIATQMQERIFEPFVQVSPLGQVNSGRGLGLPLARSLAELHGGTLLLDITNTVYNRFVLTLPLSHEEVEANSTERVQPEEMSSVIEKSSASNQPTLLLVEDNLEMIEFVAKKMMGSYHVLRAMDGLEAIKILNESEVDIVVSDIMMPHMDGMELLKIIKSQVDYSHIPVVLLTAKTNLQSKVDGLEIGADAYIEKPFSLEYLQAQVQSLLKNRRLVKEMFHKRPLTEAVVVALTKADELFLQKVNAVIEQNLTNIQFGVDLLADKLNMSRSSLHRKIKGLSDLAPNDYIRLHRLKKAALLLQEGAYRINEIATITGFASSSYFTKCFQQHFGMLPKVFTKNVHN